LLSNYRPTRPRPTTSYYISEKTKAIYGRANIDGELLGMGFRGNLGLRAVRTDFAVDTTADVGGGVMVPQHNTNHYSDLLPSANIKFSVARDL
ncbi:hypothetical protein GY659_24790, partial [Escherichia coli]|nr:hypothetical protein [Escherichia coli]